MSEPSLSMDEFDYELPPAAIAQSAASPRDSARLLVDRGRDMEPEHRRVRDLVDLLGPGDLLVVNETRVIPARLPLKKTTGGAAEVLLLEPASGRWRALVRPGRRIRPGTELLSDRDHLLRVVVGEATDDGQRIVEVRHGDTPITSAADAHLLAEAGEAPLPPYITAPTDGPERYQTVYAATPGSVAAPTAGLHFTPQLLAELAQRGVQRASVDLVVGLDTFRPVMVDDPADHVMHTER